MKEYITSRIILFLAFGTMTAFFAAFFEQIMFLFIQISLDLINISIDTKSYSFILTLILSAIIAPCVEETSKILPVIVYFREEDMGKNAFIGYSLLSALGFSLIENMIYAISGQLSFTIILIIRLAISTPMHLIATFLTAFFYYRVAFLNKGNAILVGLGMVVHGLFNGIVVLLSV